MVNDARPDGQLLAAAAREDQLAFEELVRRHGSLVYNACLRMLRHTQAAEDAAQAVFLALAHKAGDRELQSRESLAGWLYRAAWNVSVRAKEAQMQQKKREQDAVRRDVATDSADWEAIRTLLDQELTSLPEKFRLPIILHHLEGQSAAAVGTVLKCSEQAVKHRLVRGRELLRQRLLQAGVGPNLVVTALTTALAAHTAGLPESFIGATVKAGVLAAAGKSAEAAVSAQVHALSQGALSMMKMAKLKAAALILLAVGLTSGTLGLTAYTVFAGEDAKGKTAAVPAPKPAWPGWRGVHRNGVSDETGFVWPKEGPKRLWSVPTAGGNGGFAIVNGRLFASGIVDPKGQSQYQMMVNCHDAKTGKQLWSVPAGGVCSASHGTPVADDSAVYVINNKGWIGALNAETGKLLWEKDLVHELELKDMPGYGIATSPLLFGDAVIVGNVALDRKTGSVLWKRPFSSILSTDLIQIAKKDLLLCVAGENVEAVNPADGVAAWSVNRTKAYGLSQGNPLYLDPLVHDDSIYFVSGYGSGIISIKDAAFSSAKPQMSYGYSFAQLSLMNGCAIGGESGAGDGNITGRLACVDIGTGKVLWDHNEFGATHLVVDGKLVLQTLAGELIVAEASTEGYKELSRTPITDRGRPYDYTKGDRPLVTAPSFCDGRIYCRAGGIVCFELERQKTK